MMTKCWAQQPEERPTFKDISFSIPKTGEEEYQIDPTKKTFTG